MSKFLKFIVNLVVISAILVAVALLVPPLAGVKTEMNTDTEKETNIPIGTVVYAKQVEVGELKTGDKILGSSSGGANAYEILEMDKSAGVYKVKGAYGNGNEEEVSLVKYADKVILAVPFIAYAAMALESKEGLIVVGLGIVFLIILFILAELWRKDDEDDEEDDDDEEDGEEEDTEEEDDKETLSRKELKKKKKEEKKLRKAEKKEAKRKKKMEKYEEEEDDEDEEEEEIPVMSQSMNPEEAEIQKMDEVLQRAIDSVSEENNVFAPLEEVEEPAEDMDMSLEALQQMLMDVNQPEDEVKVEEEVPEVEEAADEPEIEIEEIQLTEEVEEPVYNRERVLPSPSVEELLANAKAKGEKPVVIEDEDNKVTLLDYSDVL